METGAELALQWARCLRQLALFCTSGPFAVSCSMAVGMETSRDEPPRKCCEYFLVILTPTLSSAAHGRENNSLAINALYWRCSVVLLKQMFLSCLILRLYGEFLQSGQFCGTIRNIWAFRYATLQSYIKNKGKLNSTPCPEFGFFPIEKIMWNFTRTLQRHGAYKYRYPVWIKS